MKIGILSGPYKNHLTAREIGECMGKGLTKGNKKIRTELFWMADGGEGTSERISSLFNCKKDSFRVTGPQNKLVTSNFYINKRRKIALFDVCEACGIKFVKGQNNPERTTSRGVGEVIKNLYDKGYRKFFIGLGDTAILDGGAGMMQALGWKFFDKNDVQLPNKRFDINKIKRFLKKIFQDVDMTCLTDGNTKLCGLNSISKESTIPKGGNIEMSIRIEEEMKKINKILKSISGKDYSKIAGSGSAGGLGAAFDSIFGAKLINGTDFILDSYNLLEKFKGFDMVVSSEGQINYQTIDGKAPFKVAERFNKIKVPTTLFVGSKGKGYLSIYKYGVKEIVETDAKNMTFKDIKRLKLGKRFIVNSAESFGRRIIC